MDSLCHPWFTTTNLSYRILIFETFATALCGTTGIHHKYIMNIVYTYIYIYTVYWIHMYVCMYVWMDGWMDGWMDVWMYGCMDVWMYECMNVWMYGCMYGCMYVCIYVSMYLYIYIREMHWTTHTGTQNWRYCIHRKPCKCHWGETWAIVVSPAMHVRWDPLWVCAKTGHTPKSWVCHHISHRKIEKNMGCAGQTCPYFEVQWKLFFCSTHTIW